MNKSTLLALLLLVCLVGCGGFGEVNVTAPPGLGYDGGNGVNPIACEAPPGVCEQTTEDLCVSREVGTPSLSIRDCVRAAYDAAATDPNHFPDAGTWQTPYSAFARCDLMPPCGTCPNGRRMWLFRNMQQQAEYFIFGEGRCFTWWRTGGVPTSGLMLR